MGRNGNGRGFYGATSNPVSRRSGWPNFAAIALMALLVAACGRVVDLYRVDPAIEYIQKDNKRQVPDAVDLDTYKWRHGLPKGLTGKTAYQVANWTAEKAIKEPAKGCGPLAEYYRNRLQDDLIYLSARVCDRHKAAIAVNAATFNFLGGFTSGVLSSVAAITTGGISTALSTGAASASAATAALNAEFFNNFLATAVVKEIQRLRKEKVTAIRARQSLGVMDYTVDAAIRDANDFHQTCSFYAGMVSLTGDAELREVLTRTQVDREIALLEQTNDELNKEVKGLDDSIKQGITPESKLQVTRIKRNGFRRSFRMNQIRIGHLRATRPSVPTGGAESIIDPTPIPSADAKIEYPTVSNGTVYKGIQPKLLETCKKASQE